MNKIITYIGWIGHNNLGDEAVYLSNKELFDGFELSDREYYDDSEIALYGGGTVLPHPNHSEIHNKKLIAAIGTGIKDPAFRNQPFAPIDINYCLGRKGLTHWLNNRFIRYGLQQLNSKLEMVKIRQDYIHKSMIENMDDIDYLGVRGPHSKQILDQYNVKCDIIGDTALILEPFSYKQQFTNKIAVTLKAGGDTMKHTNDKEYMNIVKSFCQDYSSEYNFIFLPFRPRDIPIHVELARAVENSTFKDYCSHVDVQAVIDEFAKCDAVIGERLHAGVLAACSYTPFLSLGYQPKHIDFTKSIGMEKYHIQIGHLTRRWLEKELSNVVNSEELNNHLNDEVNQKRSKITAFANDVKDEARKL